MSELEEQDDASTTQSRLARLGRHAPSILGALGALLIGIGIGTMVGDEPQPPEPEEQAESAAEHVHKSAVYTCSMHPQIRSDEPGLCPICGMDLIPVEGADQGDEDGPITRVQLSERARKLAKIRTTPVRKATDDAQQISLLGRVDHDETRIRTVTAWTEGRIDRLHVATTGEEVRAGQTIATLYSPEVYTAHRDLIEARQQLQKLSGAMEFARTAAEATLESARQKLRLLGVSKEVIEQMEQESSARTEIKIQARFGGTVIEKLVNEGTYIDPGTGIYRLADLDHLWVQLDAYESDLSRLRVGQPVQLTATALPGEQFTGKIAFIDPTVDPTKRTTRVRVEVENKDGKLKPGMFVEAVVEGQTAGDRPPPLVIPETAPLFAGPRSVVYVEVPGTERPTYEVREVKLGPKTGSSYPVIGGLAAGERVVTHGAFTVDADLQIKGGASLMTRGAPIWEDEALPTSPALRTALAKVVSAYLVLQAALADDDLAAAKAAAKALAKASSDADPSNLNTSARAAEVWTEIQTELGLHAPTIEGAPELAVAREAFEPLTAALVRILSAFGNPTDEALNLAHCPMAFDNRGADWIQRGETIDNAYFGEEMLTCGDIENVIEPGAALLMPREAPETGAAGGGHQH